MLVLSKPFAGGYEPNSVDSLSTLRRQHIYLPKLRNNLFSYMPLLYHQSYPRCKNHTSERVTSKEADQEQAKRHQRSGANELERSPDDGGRSRMLVS